MSTSIADLKDRLVAAGFTVEELGCEPIFWSISLANDGCTDDDGGTLFYAIVIPNQYSCPDVYVKNAVAVSHGEIWYRTFHRKLSIAIHQQDEEGRNLKTTSSTSK